MSFHNQYQYFITMLYSFVALCGGGWWLDTQLKNNYFGLSQEHIRFVLLCQGYGYALVQIIVIFACLELLGMTNGALSCIVVGVVLLMWSIGCVGIVHQSHGILSRWNTTRRLFLSLLSSLPSFVYRHSHQVAIFLFTCIRMITKSKGISIIFLLLLAGGANFVSAQVDLSLNTMLMNGGTGLYQNTEPSVTLFIANNGTSPALVTGNPINSGFITCTVDSQTVFNSNPITTLVINANTTLQFPIVLSALATRNVGNNKTLTCQLGTYPGRGISTASQILSFSVREKPIGRFDMTLDKVKQPISNKLDGAVAELGVGGVKSWVYHLIDSLAVPLAVLVGIFLSLIALYRMMLKEDQDLKEISSLILWGVVGILLMLSAKFIGRVLVNDILFNGEIGVGQFSTIDFVAKIYDLILYPFLKLFYYIAMSSLFVVLVFRVISFVNDSAEEVKKKSANIIVATALGLLTIIGSKQLVEGVYGREAQIRSGSAITITDVGSSFLSDANIPIIYAIIQRVMGLAGLAVLAIIVFQTFKMLTDPTNESNLGDIRKTILYVVIGMFVIGGGYLIVNVLMLN